MRKRLMALVVSLAVFWGTVAENEICATSYNGNSSKHVLSDHNAAEKIVFVNSEDGYSLAVTVDDGLSVWKIQS